MATCERCRPLSSDGRGVGAAHDKISDPLISYKERKARYLLA